MSNKIATSVDRIPSQRNTRFADAQRHRLKVGCISWPGSNYNVEVQWSNHGVSAVRFLKESRGLGSSVQNSMQDSTHDSVPRPWSRRLGEYLAGWPVDLTPLPIHLVGSEFQLRVWNTLRTIPRGAVWTYGQVAQAIGCPGAQRAVGQANGRNPLPILVPCHRVVSAGGSLGGFSGGLDVKRQLLELEGADWRSSAC